MDFTILTKSWENISKHNEIHPSASKVEISVVEEILKIRLPDSFQALFNYSNGLSILEGNLNVVPLKSDDYFNLVTMTSQLREWGKVIPEEILAFGDNGSDSTFGVWLEKNSLSDSPIIEIGVIYDSHCLAIAGTSLFNFLLGWTAYYSLLLEVNSKALDIIQLPSELRFKAHELEDEHFEAIRKWADPNLPIFNPDPYEQKYDVSQVREILARSAT